MSQENVARAKLAFGAFKSALETGDLERFATFVHPDFEYWVAQDMYAATGLEGMKRSLASWDEAWEWWTIEAEDFIDAGESVLVIQRTRGRARQSGVDLDDLYYSVCEFRGDKLARIPPVRRPDGGAPGRRAAGVARAPPG